MKKFNTIRVIKLSVLLFLVIKINAQQLTENKINNVITDTIQKNNIKFSNENLKKTKKDTRPKVSLPFYVYKEGEKLPYTPSGLMGNYKDLKVETRNKKNVHIGDFSMKISYNSNVNWYGVAMVNPADDWGNIDGGYDISGAKIYSFWARASEKNVRAKIGFGMIGKDKKFPDTARLEKEFKLSNKWKKYSFKLKNLDLSRIRTGFVLFSGGIGKPYEIFIDEIVFK